MFDDVAGYPTAIITKIYSDITALSPSPPFVVSTGDYTATLPDSGAAPPQLDIYLAARAMYEGVGFKVVGERRNYYRQPVEDALVMTMRLAPKA